jgi:hypothetical protein
MNKTTRKIVDAFQSRRSLRIANSYTDGQCVWLFGNMIAEWRDGDLWITNAGWKSKTTKERLNGLDGVSIAQHRGEWYLNGHLWGGNWTNVQSWNTVHERQEPEVGMTWQEAIESPRAQREAEFNVTSEWMDEGYSKPVYSVYHTNDESSRTMMVDKLISNGIPYKLMESDTVGVYKPNYFIVVRPKDYKQSLKTITQ